MRHSVYIYEAYVKSKFRYKIHLAMNDVTSMLYVSLVRQFETLLFYVVTSRIEALVVSHHKFLIACVEKVYRLLLQQIVYCHFLLCIWHRVSENADFQSIRCTVFQDTFGKKSAGSVILKRLFSWIITSICCTRWGVTMLG